MPARTENQFISDYKNIHVRNADHERVAALMALAFEQPEYVRAKALIPPMLNTKETVMYVIEAYAEACIKGKPLQFEAERGLQVLAVEDGHDSATKAEVNALLLEASRAAGRLYFGSVFDEMQNQARPWWKRVF